MLSFLCFNCLSNISMSHLHLRELTCCNRRRLLGFGKNCQPPNCWGSKTYTWLGCISWDVVSQDRIKIFLPGFYPNPHVNVTSIHILYWGSTSSLCLTCAFHSTNGRPWHAAMWPISPPAAHSLGNPGAKSHAHSKIGAKKLKQR